MALVVETGTGADPTANSYVDVTAIKAYLDARGTVYPADDTKLEQQATIAMDYIEGLEPSMLGYRTYGLDQPLSFPRTGIYYGSIVFSPDEIPQVLKNAQCELCSQQVQGVDIMPVTTGQAVKRRKVGPIEREFFGPAEAPTFPVVNNWLQWLLKGGGIYGQLDVIRA